MISDITIGQYYPANSVLHRLDARIKLCLTAALVGLMFFCKSFPALGLSAAMTLLAVLLSRVPLRMLWKSMRPILYILVFTAVLNLFYGKGGDSLLPDIWLLRRITLNGIYLAVFMAVRIICLVLISALLTYTTTPTLLTDAIERLLSPLAYLRIPIHTLAMMMTLALRFIPVLIEEIERIMNAQKARGADFESGGLLSRAKALLPILVPLLISAFRRAYDLAFAMECRCYTGGKGRTRMKQMRLLPRDGLAVLVLCAYGAGVILLNRYFFHVM